MAESSSKIIKGYRLIGELGAGGFGAVYRAHQTLLKRDVAIKVILPEHANKPDFVRRFEIEAELVARLEHPHIVPIYDFWRDPDGAYIVMRFIKGVDLRQKLETAPLSESEATHILDQIASALHFAHRHLVVHRDLKPENILIDEDGNAYLLDFGIAKDLSRIQDPNSQGGGTLMYASPEQLKGEPVTPQTDLYSLGLLVYEMLTGNLPHERTSPHAIKQIQFNEDLPNIDSISNSILGVLRRATHAQPEERFANAIDFANAFRNIVSVSDPVSVAPSLEIDDEFIELTNPYKGLMAFQEYDSHNFFGRGALVSRLVDHLKINDESGRFLALVGPSGSGKSSVIKAGLLPHIRNGDVVGSENWFVVEMYPSKNPYIELEAALLRIAVNPPESLLTQLQENNGISRAIRRILPANDNVELILVIDQFEELFTLVQNESLRMHFINSLLDTIEDDRGRLRVVVTLRADFYDKPMQYRKFGEMLDKRKVSVFPMSHDELSDAIIKPAQQVGAELQSGLLESIINDVNEQPGMLPLLQYTLMQLFDQRQGRTLTLNAYRQLGGVTGALAQQAEEIFEQLSPVQQRSTRQLFLRLVTLGEGTEDTRRRVQQTELEAIPEIDEILDRFGMARLLTFDRDPITRVPTMEVAHEALIRSWDRFKEWVNDSRDDLRIQRNLTTATNEWLASDQELGFLARDARLEQFEAWTEQTNLVLSRDEHNFLTLSRQAREERENAEILRKTQEAEIARRAQNFQRASALLAVMVVIMIGVTFVGVQAIFFSQEADRASRTEVAVANAAQATALIREGEANTQVFIAGETLTPIAPTLTTVSGEIQTAQFDASIANEQVATSQVQADNLATEVEQINELVAIATREIATSIVIQNTAFAGLETADADRNAANALALTANANASTAVAGQTIADMGQMTAIAQQSTADALSVTAQFEVNEANERVIEVNNLLITATTNLLELNQLQTTANANLTAVPLILTQVVSDAQAQATELVATSNAAQSTAQAEFDIVTNQLQNIVDEFSDEPSAWLINGLYKYEIGDFEGAIADYNEAIRLDSDYTSAYNNRGNAKRKLGDYEGALADYGEAIRLNPDYALVYRNRGLIKEDLGDYEGAIADYDEAIRLNPDYASAYNNRGTVKRELGDYEGALADYGEAIRLDPEDTLAYRNRGDAKQKLGDHAGAIADYDEAIRLDPDYTSAYNNRGVSKEGLGDYQGAIADYDEAIRLDPNDVIFYRNRGNAKYELGDYQAAIIDYDEAIRLDPDYRSAYRNRGKAKYELGDYQAAIDDYSEAIRLDPNDKIVYYDRAYTKDDLGDYHGVIVDLTEAIRIDPNYAIAYWLRGNAHHALDDLDEAVADYQTYERLSGQLEPFMLDIIDEWESQRDN